MTVLTRLKALKGNESGTITIDWVVLLAALVGLGVAILSTVQTGVQDLSGDMSTYLMNQAATN